MKSGRSLGTLAYRGRSRDPAELALKETYMQMKRQRSGTDTIEFHFLPQTPYGKGTQKCRRHKVKQHKTLQAVTYYSLCLTKVSPKTQETLTWQMIIALSTEEKRKLTFAPEMEQNWYWKHYFNLVG